RLPAGRSHRPRRPRAAERAAPPRGSGANGRRRRHRATGGGMSIQAFEARNGDVRLAYGVRGEGDPLLFIHGLGYDRVGWGPLPGLLARDFHVITFDNRGVGESDVPGGPYSVAQMAADAIAVLDAAGIDRAHVFGASLGGFIAQELAI